MSISATSGRFLPEAAYFLPYRFRTAFTCYRCQALPSGPVHGPHLCVQIRGRGDHLFQIQQHKLPTGPIDRRTGLRMEGGVRPKSDF